MSLVLELIGLWVMINVGVFLNEFESQLLKGIKLRAFMILGWALLGVVCFIFLFLSG